MKNIKNMWVQACLLVLGVIGLILGLTLKHSTDTGVTRIQTDERSITKINTSPQESTEDQPFYDFHFSCQIPKLSQLYETYLGCKTDGVFVEFGAYDGKTFGNTWGLAEKGWRGVYIEPVPSLVENCRGKHHDHPRVTVHEYAVGPDEREITIRLGGVYTTANETFAKVYDQDFKVDMGETITVQQKPLQAILEEAQIEPHFDLMVVDVEGYEWEALRNFDLDAWSPTMVIIEIEDRHPSFQTKPEHLTEEEFQDIRNRFAKLRHYFSSRDYEIVFQDFINTVYVKV